ncbi:DUF397 domain-containing protein [Kitasatospora sp. NPDC056651]|uniref:DUF397 domain-containing protein n=1 Tax=Kitasatospora sp. NPDC056651 TaxID=3345892 RepID=UPI0036750BBB
MLQSNWQKSSFSSSGDNCVEVRTSGRAIELRESDEGHLILRTTPTALADLLLAFKANEFDYPPVR